MRLLPLCYSASRNCSHHDDDSDVSDTEAGNNGKRTMNIEPSRDSIETEGHMSKFEVTRGQSSAFFTHCSL